MTRVLVAMSGGVDSSFSAALLKEQGHDVVGVTYKIWPCSEIDDVSQRKKVCCSPIHFRDASEVAKKLGFPHYLVDLEDGFEKNVIQPFCNDYWNGRTPNPCVLCNQYIKFGALWDWACDMGMEKIATGHYAIICQDQSSGRYFLKSAKDKKKDQSYFLFSLSQEQLERTIFPLGEITKEEVRKGASLRGLIVADKKESQDICFVPDNDYVSFLLERRPGYDEEGDIVDREGNILGRHKGAFRYTIGQRRGLGLALGSPYYVISLNCNTRQVVIGTKDELLSSKVIVKNPTYGKVTSVLGKRGIGKVRYTHQGAPCSIIEESKTGFNVLFDSPQYSITPGQAFCLYNEEGELMAGGWIDFP